MLFQYLLVTALHRAVALEQVHHVAVGVAEHLDLDVTRALEVALDQHAIVAEDDFASRFEASSCAAKADFQ